MDGVTLRIGEAELTLTSTRARALAASLWDDPTRGAASVAAQIAAELKIPPAFGRVIELGEREATLVERALGRSVDPI
ncbi:MAG: hypothetical protein HOQ28_10235 [Thermoleophilia bacterium]|nr:hypothetical protein [Thermoleophilia bacterium]